MCNCNNKRAAYNQQNKTSINGLVKAMVAENKPMILIGNVTGRTYFFKNSKDVQWLDKRDAMAIDNKNEFKLI